MITLVWRTDVHMADASPQSRTDNWPDTIINKLAQVGEIARGVNADAVIDGGDFFHVKSPTRNSHEVVRRVTEVHSRYPCPVYANVGNHDVKYGSIEFLNESPLAVLFETNVFRRLYDTHEALFTSDDGTTVRVVGVPYHGTKYDLNKFTSIVKGNETFLIVVAHCLASPKGGTMFEAEDIIGYSQLTNLDPDVWCFGHWHKDQGVTEIANGKWVVNVGSLSRGSISQDDVGRIPSCVVMRASIIGMEIEQVMLKVGKPADVFDIGAKERSTNRKVAMDIIVDQLKSNLTMRDSGSVLDVVRGANNVPDEVKERTIDYLERAGAR